MPVDLSRQSRPNPMLWLALAAPFVVAGAWYFLRRQESAPTPVAEAGPPSLPEKKPSGEKPEEKDEPPVTEAPPEAPRYAPPADAQVVSGKTGAGPDEQDKAMWEIRPTAEHPHTVPAAERKEFLKRLAAYMAKPAGSVVAHPGASVFPGEVPAKAPRLIQSVAVDLNTPHWCSTGLYAPPGETIAIRVPAELKGAEVIIGPHVDNHAECEPAQFNRFPLISTTAKLTAPVVETANPFGGLIYIHVPEKDGAEGAAPVWVSVAITGGVEAPVFRLGATTPEEWERIRLAPAPWGELAGKLHIATDRSERFRSMSYETAEQLAEYWDKVVETQDWLCAYRPLGYPQRLVADVDYPNKDVIGHSGYPYVVRLTSRWADYASRNDGYGHWTEYALMGHNHQRAAWTFGPKYEYVSNAVLALCCYDKVTDIRLGDGKGWLGPVQVALDKRLGRNGYKAREGNYTNLAVYVPVIQAFGWESLRDVYSLYGRPEGVALATAAETRKREAFVIAWSRRCQVNLGPYFELFGFPYTKSMKTSLGGLKTWMPENYQLSLAGSQ